MKSEKKSAVITFKVEDELMTALEKIPNKSEFIRGAVAAALSETCPLCDGVGVLNERQLKHWKNFVKEHTLHRCSSCNGLSIKCHAHKENIEGEPKK